MHSEEIPIKYRREHSSGSKACILSAPEHSAFMSSFYTWQAFGGCVFYVTTPPETLKNQKPTVKIYVNDSLHQTITPSATALSGKYLYEVMFSGLMYGDEYYITVTYGDNTFGMNRRTYIGKSGLPPVLSETAVQINAETSAPYDKSYSMPLGVISFSEDYGSLNSYSREARTRFIESCLQYTEVNAVLGKVSNLVSVYFDQYDYSTGEWQQPSVFTREAQIYRFGYDKLSVYNPVKVGISSATSVSYYSYFSSYVNAWISDVCELLGGEYFVRDDGIGEDDFGIRITLGSHKDLYGYIPEEATGKEVEIYYGTWTQTHWYSSTGGTKHCEVKLCNELRNAMNEVSAFKNIVYEELTECLGCGNDTYRVYDSLFSEIWYIGKENNLIVNGTPTYDGEVVQLLYNEFEMGETISEVIHRLTPSQACVVKLPCIKWGNVRNKAYSLSTYAMNRKVSWTTDGDGTSHWNWNDSGNCFSDIESSALTVTPAYSTPLSDPVVSARGADFLKVDVYNTNTYDVKAVDNDGKEYVTSSASGRYIYIKNLSPTTSYRIYSKIADTPAWFGGNTATTNPSPPKLTVWQSEDTLKITVNAPNDCKCTYLYIVVYYYLDGKYTSSDIRPAVSGETYTFTADSGKSFTICANTIYTLNATELWSEAVTCYGTMGKISASAPTAKRIDGGLLIDWDTVENATNYQVRLMDTETNLSTYSTASSPPCKVYLSYGVTYKLSLNTYNGGWLGYCADEIVTTAPAHPVIDSVLQSNGVITVSWRLMAKSNVSNVYINLYTSGGTLLQSKTFQNVSSGSFSYSAVAEGDYQIRASSSLLVGNSEIFCVDGNGNEYKLYRNVRVSSRPEYFYWNNHTAYMHSGGIISYVPYTAWNALISNIKEMISFTGKNDVMPSSESLYGSAAGKTYLEACSYSCMDLTDKTVYAWKFNIANYIISNIGKDTGVETKYSKNSNFNVCAGDFTALQDTINSIE